VLAETGVAQPNSFPPLMFTNACAMWLIPFLLPRFVKACFSNWENEGGGGIKEGEGEGGRGSGGSGGGGEGGGGEGGGRR
jgi:hypothetical protein